MLESGELNEAFAYTQIRLGQEVVQHRKKGVCHRHVFDCTNARGAQTNISPFDQDTVKWYKANIVPTKVLAQVGIPLDEGIGVDGGQFLERGVDIFGFDVGI
jgi:hypothetical protein